MDESYWKSQKVQCEKVYECFSYVLSLGMRWSQGIGSHLIVTKYTTDRFYVGKLIYEMLFYVFINRVLILVVFGIIVSTFGQ